MIGRIIVLLIVGIAIWIVITEDYSSKEQNKVVKLLMSIPVVQNINKSAVERKKQQAIEDQKRKEQRAIENQKIAEANKRYLEKQAELRKQREEAYDRYVNTRDSLRDDGKHIYVNSYVYGDESNITISLQQKKIGVFNYKKKSIQEYMVTDFDSITKIQMIERADSQNTRNNSLAGAALGTVVAGGVGTIAGAVAGGSHGYNHVRELSVRIFYEEDGSVHSIKSVLCGPTDNKDSAGKHLIRDGYKKFDQLDDFFQEQQFNVEYIR